MGHRAVQKPKHLAEKLLAVRRSFGLTQPQMAQRLGVPSYVLFYHRISEFEHGRRIPNVLVLLAYARAANIPLEALVNDEIELKF